jgi:hypothetical protein
VVFCPSVMIGVKSIQVAGIKRRKILRCHFTESSE